MANYASLGPPDFEEAIARKLPPRGLAWATRVPGTVFQGFWQVIADAIAAVHARAGVLTETEAWPPSSVELLSDWEEVFGLPDNCLPVPSATTARQAAVAARLGSTGGQSIPYFEQLAINLGGAIEVTEFAPFRASINRANYTPQPLYQLGAAYTWEIALSGNALFYFEAGVSSAGEPLWQYANSPIECEIKRLQPAHTQTVFTGF